MSRGRKTKKPQININKSMWNIRDWCMGSHVRYEQRALSRPTFCVETLNSFKSFRLILFFPFHLFRAENALPFESNSSNSSSLNERVNSQIGWKPINGGRTLTPRRLGCMWCFMKIIIIIIKAHFIYFGWITTRLKSQFDGIHLFVWMVCEMR